VLSVFRYIQEELEAMNKQRDAVFAEKEKTISKGKWKESEIDKFVDENQKE
jgi:hypothetical protein